MKLIKKSQGLLILFLLPIFFQRFFIGGEVIESYSELRGFSLAWLGFFSHGIITIIALSDRKTLKNRILFRYFLPLFLLSAFHIILLLIDDNIGTTNAVLGIVRALLWVFCCGIIIQYTSEEEFLDILLKLVEITFLVIFASTIIYYTTHIPLQILISDGTPRAQGFLTEPSGVGVFMAGYVALATYNKNLKKIVYSILITLMINSVITLVGFAIGIIIGFSTSKLGRMKSYRHASIYFPLIILASLFTIQFFATYLSNASTNYLESYNQASSFYSIFIERILGAASGLENSIELAKSGENIESGGLFRYSSALLLVEQLSNSWRAWIGYGLGAHAQLMLAQNTSILDFGIIPYLLSSFGFIITPIILIWLSASLTRKLSPLMIFSFPFFIIATFNSAGGIHAYSIVLASAFLLSTNKVSGIKK